MKRIRILDTTLRDGEQTPGIHWSKSQKVELARQLEKLGVDVIEAGFPASSAGDAEAVAAVASSCRTAVVCALARMRREDIDEAAKALACAAHPRIHVFLACSDIHLERKLHIAREEALRRIRDGVAYAKTLCDDVQFSPEDATRSDPDFLLEAVREAAAAGATTVNIPDTVGYAMTEEFAALIRRVRAALPENVAVSVHCHDDLGMAVANSIAAVAAGAVQHVDARIIRQSPLIRLGQHNRDRNALAHLFGTDGQVRERTRHQCGRAHACQQNQDQSHFRHNVSLHRRESATRISSTKRASYVMRSGWNWNAMIGRVSCS